MWKMNDEALSKAIKDILALMKAMRDGNFASVSDYVYDSTRKILGCSTMCMTILKKVWGV